MNNQKKLFFTIAEVLEIKKSSINENSSSDTLKNWDSLAMINIIIELEKQFNVKFDTLEIARQKYPGAQNSLDALCKRFNIDNSKREKHSAIEDCKLLREVYINLVDQREPKLNLNTSEVISPQYNDKLNQINNKPGVIIKPSEEEINLHKKYLKSDLQKNYFN